MKQISGITTSGFGHDIFDYVGTRSTLLPYGDGDIGFFLSAHVLEGSLGEATACQAGGH
jgi:hypothetical protein